MLETSRTERRTVLLAECGGMVQADASPNCRDLTSLPSLALAFDSREQADAWLIAANQVATRPMTRRFEAVDLPAWIFKTTGKAPSVTL